MPKKTRTNTDQVYPSEVTLHDDNDKRLQEAPSGKFIDIIPFFLYHFPKLTKSFILADHFKKFLVSISWSLLKSYN